MTARSLGLLGSASLAIFTAELAACSTDGVTPDCSDAAACAPRIGDAAPSDDASVDAADGAVTDADADGG